MAGFSSSPDDHRPIAEINVTPLVDVMLVLLIIFMVTAPFMESGIPLQLPKASGKALTKDENPTVLTVTKDGKIYLGREEVPEDELGKSIAGFFKNKSKKEILVKADGALPYAVVARTMASVKNAGVYKIGLVTLPEPNKPGK